MICFATGAATLPPVHTLGLDAARAVDLATTIQRRFWTL